MENEPQPEEIEVVINEMPDYATLQEFLGNMVNGTPVTVWFNYETGRFERDGEV